MADKLEFEKETPENAAIHILNCVETGCETIFPDNFSHVLAEKVKTDPKAAEQDVVAHKMPENFLVTAE